MTMMDPTTGPPRSVEIQREARAAIELRARLPQLVQEAIAQVLEEADDLEHAKELAGLEAGEGES